MILNVFAVYDRQGEAYATPMFIPMTGQAVRSFTDQINKPAEDNPLYQHPDDFDLWCLGAYDTSTGLFTENSPHVVCLGKNVKLNGK